MIKSRLSLLFLGAFLSLAGCSTTHYESPKVDLNQFSQGNKAIVVSKGIFKAHHWIRGEFDTGLMTVWRKLEDIPAGQHPVRYRFNKPGFAGSSKDMEAYMIDPGIYTLEEIKGDDGQWRYHGSYGRGEGASDFRVFSVEPGDVVYIGTIFVPRERRAPKIADHFSKAQAYMGKSYPSLSQRLKKSLANTSCLTPRPRKRPRAFS